jgi:hypothetical protein
MRAMLSLGGLLVVLLIITLLARKQSGSVQDIKLPATPASASVVIERPTANGNVQQQSQQIQQQFKAATEAAMQQPRSEPE